MKRSKFKNFLLTGVTLFSFIGVLAATFTWFLSTITIDGLNGTGIVNNAYFAYGDGQPYEEDINGNIIHQPFGIKDTKHLNNLAWLQYNGNFGNNSYQFELANDINVNGSTFVIPPIGTEAHPFIGTFDGNGHTINNIKVTNDSSEFSDKPINISYSQSDAEVVGFFGVVGTVGGNSLSNEVNNLSDFTLNNIEVESKSTNTLIGLAAGYINAEMSGVKVGGEATLNVNDKVHTAKTAYTNKLTDYGLVGYSTKTAGNGTYSQSLSNWYDALDPAYGGQSTPALGGHTSIKEIYDRLNSIPKTETHYARKQTQTKYANGTYSAITTDNIQNSNVLHDYADNDNYVGSFCFSDSASPVSQISDFNLTGKRNVTKEILDEAAGERMVFFNNGSQETYSGSTYLFPRNNESSNVFSNTGPRFEDNPSKSNGWYFTNSDNFTVGTTTNLGALYTVSGGDRYYLCVFRNAAGNIFAQQRKLASVPSSEDFTWTLEYRGTVTPDFCGITMEHVYIYAKLNGTRYYLRYGGALQSTATDNNNRFYMRVNSYPISIYESTNLYDNNDTYFPLMAAGNAAAINNTGYVVSGSDYEPNTNLKSSGTVSVARFQKSGTYNYGADMEQNTIRTVYGGSDVLANSISNYQEFSSRYTDFNPSGNYGTYFYGLRFNDSAISAGNFATIPKGKLNNAEFTNRDVPKNCIDFSLGARGTTAFFAGTFREGSTSAFFSLHKINRSGSTLISTEEILQIYKHKTDAKQPYIYITSDSNPTINSSTYELAFDTSWITSPTSLTEHKIYYFEIPLNAGEYALGAVPGKGGAYLMYFDIGASEMTSEDQVYGYKITTNQGNIVYPIGIDFNLAGGSNDGGGTFCIYINSNSRGSISLNVVSSSNISVTDSNAISTYAYQGAGFKNSSFTVSGNSPGQMAAEQIISTRAVYAFVVTTSGESHTIVIVENTSYTLDGVSYNSLNDLLVAAPIFGTDNYNTIMNLGNAVTLTRVGSGPKFNIVPDYLTSDRTSVVVTLDATGVTVTASNITTYKIYKGSMAQANLMANNQNYVF